MKNDKGLKLKQKIKSGELSPDEAIKTVETSETPSQNFLNWAKGPGRRRYAQALKNKEVAGETVKKQSKKKE